MHLTGNVGSRVKTTAATMPHGIGDVMLSRRRIEKQHRKYRRLTSGRLPANITKRRNKNHLAWSRAAILQAVQFFNFGWKRRFGHPARPVTISWKGVGQSRCL
jgi:hypothetical protein